MADPKNETTRKDDTRMNVFKGILQSQPRKLAGMFREREFEDLEALLNCLPNTGRDRESAFEVIRKAFALIKSPLYNQSEGYADLASDNFRSALHFVHAYITSSRASEREHKSLLELAAQQRVFGQKQREYGEQMRKLAETDRRTGAYNDLYFETTLLQEIAEAEKYHPDHPLSLVFFDIDHFKSINDTIGHAAGNYVLKELVDTVRGLELETRKPSDTLARWGGEEFALILPETNEMQASLVGEKIRKGIETHPFVYDSKPVKVTVSVGVTQYSPPQTMDDLFKLVDACMYAGKLKGRNKVVTATELRQMVRSTPFEPGKVKEMYKLDAALYAQLTGPDAQPLKAPAVYKADGGAQ
jgi:diguanylate cyclase (GGDEF)-like protein